MKKNHRVSPCFAAIIVINLLFSLSLLSAQPAAKKDSTVLITGANRGLGLALVRQFVAGGYEVIGTVRKPEKAEELKATGAKVMKLDVTSQTDIDSVAKALEGKKLDILINNAGYFGPKLMTENPDNLAKLTREEINNCFQVNAMGPLFLTKALLPNLQLAKNAKIVNISTRSSILSSRGRGAVYGYRVSKTALNMATRTMSGDKAVKGMIVVAIAPGHNKTDMGTERGKLDPKDSMAQVKSLIENLTPKHNGGLWYYNGKKLPW